VQRIMLSADVSGTLTQKKYIDVLPQPLLSDGEFDYAQHRGLKWTTLRPIDSLLVLDDQGIRQNVDGETAWEIDARQPAAVTITRVMAGLLASDWQVLQQYFEISGRVNADSWQLDLLPTDAGMQSIVTSLAVTGDKFVETMIMHEANGDRTEITFQINAASPPAGTSTQHSAPVSIIE